VATSRRRAARRSSDAAMDDEGDFSAAAAWVLGEEDDVGTKKEWLGFEAGW
jgi:hypothetical protein